MKRINKLFGCIFFYCVFILTSFTVIAQNKADFETMDIDKPVKDFPVKYSSKTPLEAYIAINYIGANGKQSMWRPFSTYRFHHSFANENTKDKTIPEKNRNEILNREIKECIIYKDSVAAVITTSDKDSLYLIRYLSKENGQWLNAGEGIEEGLAKAKASIIDYLPQLASFIPKIEIVKQTPTDTINFVNYLKTHGRSPHRYIIEKLTNHKIVIYGERHRRKASWELLNKVIQEPDFVKTTGVVFFELPSYKQNDLDQFYAQEILDTDILLDIFGCEQMNGWHDKDEFDFMIALWKLNKKLPEDLKIKVILTDYQTPWHLMRTDDDLRNFPRKDRNTNMADVIEHFMKTTIDKRNALFIVGFMHAYKSPSVPGMFSTPKGQESAHTVGAQLVERFSKKDVFSIFSHCLSESNRGEVAGKLRNGLFDYVFDVNSNIPIAFDLMDSPFGREPFDAGLEVKFNPKIGSYQENYDGYIFFQKLEEEEKGTPLYELFTDQYVTEVKRRAFISGMKENQIWYGVPIKDLNKKTIISSMKKDSEGKMWNFTK